MLQAVLQRARVLHAVERMVQDDCAQVVLGGRGEVVAHEPPEVREGGVVRDEERGARRGAEEVRERGGEDRGEEGGELERGQDGLEGVGRGDERAGDEVDDGVVDLDCGEGEDGGGGAEREATHCDRQ